MDNVSTHAPHAGSDFLVLMFLQMYEQFQPTLPMRGATNRTLHASPQSDVSTHAPHAGSDCACNLRLAVVSGFQPTLPMRGATVIHDLPFNIPKLFQPTLPMRGATQFGRKRYGVA